MADSGAIGADSALAGCCAIFCATALETWCFIRPRSSSTSNACGGPRGCCPSCFGCISDDPNAEDDFERAERKDRERAKQQKRKHKANGGVETKEEEALPSPEEASKAQETVTSQPPAAPPMDRDPA